MIPVVTWDRLQPDHPDQDATTAATTTESRGRGHPPELLWDNGCGRYGRARPGCAGMRRTAPAPVPCHDGGGPGTRVVEAEVGLQQPRDQWADERAEVDAEIEQREAAVVGGAEEALPSAHRNG